MAAVRMRCPWATTNIKFRWYGDSRRDSNYPGRLSAAAFRSCHTLGMRSAVPRSSGVRRTRWRNIGRCGDRARSPISHGKPRTDDIRVPDQSLDAPAIAVGGGHGQNKKHPPPNVLLIITDQHYIRAMGAAGNPYVRTPNIDSIARQGTRFANSWCTSPVCSPARASILTGCLPHTTGVDYLGQRLNPKVPTLGELFRGSGYETAWAGKWHLPIGFPGARFPEHSPSAPGRSGFRLPELRGERQEPGALRRFHRRAYRAGCRRILNTKSRTRPFLLAFRCTTRTIFAIGLRAPCPRVIRARARAK